MKPAHPYQHTTTSTTSTATALLQSTTATQPIRTGAHFSQPPAPAHHGPRLSEEAQAAGHVDGHVLLPGVEALAQVDRLSLLRGLQHRLGDLAKQGGKKKKETKKKKKRRGKDKEGNARKRTEQQGKSHVWEFC
eukprot:2468414-Rhodomonas_salina.2